MDQLNPTSSSSRADRKTIEKNRRNLMKALYSQLNSLVSHHRSKEVGSVTDQLDEAARYIKKLQVRLERLKEKKGSLVESEKSTRPPGFAGNYSNSSSRVLKIHEFGSALELVLTTGLDCRFMFNETIRILHEEGADVVTASYSVVNGDTVFHTVHCKIGESAMGPRGARLSERLKKFVEANIGS